MAFFDEMRHYFLFFILFGLWTTWENSKHKSFLRTFSVFQSFYQFYAFRQQFSSISFIKFHEFTSLSSTVANSFFVFTILAHSIIVLESIFQSRTQLDLIRNFSLDDEHFCTELAVRIPYKREKCKNVVRMFLSLLIEFTVGVFTIVRLNFQNHDYDLFFPHAYPYQMIWLRTMQVSFFVYLVQVHSRVEQHSWQNCYYVWMPFADNCDAIFSYNNIQFILGIHESFRLYAIFKPP